MTGRSYLIVLTAGLLLSVGGISKGMGDNTVSPTVTTNLQASGGNETITLTVGGTIVQTLTENPTTGYQWNCSNSAPGVCRVVEDKFIPPSGTLMGAPGTRQWKFLALAPGRAVLSFRYIRSWEKKPEPAEQHTVVIEVKSK